MSLDAKIKMRIGFASIYSWRPHVEHVFYLSQLVRDAGHEVSYLTCDADLPTCYTRELRTGTMSGVVNCLTCRMGGLRTFANKGVVSIGAMRDESTPGAERARDWSSSSASTLGRFESEADYRSPEFADLVERLAPAAEMAYSAARNWISQQKLDAVCVFNGRMDTTRAVIEAARDAGIRFITSERTWFGDGLQLLADEYCLGLKAVHRTIRDWRDKPLTRSQAIRAAKPIASRFTRSNIKEWQAYNVAASEEDWPITGARHRVLLLPGSGNEIWGHPDWQDEWPEKSVAYDAVCRHLGLSPEDVVLRCHPNWSGKIGMRDGERATAYYTQWAYERGFHVIPSTASASTLGLIDQADAILTSGSSAGLDAGILGKQVISVSPSSFREAGFQDSACGPDELALVRFSKELDAATQSTLAATRARQALRYMYTMGCRIPQYVDFVRSQTTTQYEYFEGADPERFLDLIRTGELKTDDATNAETVDEEDIVLAMIHNREWQKILDEPLETLQAPLYKVKRRLAFRAVDGLREYLPRGHLLGG